MKKPLLVSVLVIACCVFLSSAAFGLEQPGGAPQMSGSFMNPPLRDGMAAPSVNPGIKLLNEGMQINVLAELTGLSQENVRQLLISSPPQAILDSYGVAPEAFGAAMDKQTAKLITQATAAGVITKNQADDIQKKLSKRPSGPCPAALHK